MTSPAPEGLYAAEFDAVIFDLDGTLIDSTPAVIRCWTRWAEEFNVPLEQLSRNHGVPAASVVRATLPASLWEQATARITELELIDLAGVEALPGARDALIATQARAAIATSCTADLARVRLGAARLTPPPVLVTVDDVARGKPAPDPYLEAARRLGIAPARCLVVEDAPQGLVSARAAGCRTLAVTTTSPRGELDADLVVPDLSSVRFGLTGTGVGVRPAAPAPDTARRSPSTP